VQIKTIFILLFISVVAFSYRLPFNQQQRIYFGETLKERSFHNFSFKIDAKNSSDSATEYKIDKSMKNSDDLLTYILSNLFLNHKESLVSFQKKHKITRNKSYFRLYDNKMPVIVYGNDKKVTDYSLNEDFRPEIWLNNEKSYPVKVIFKKDGNLIMAEFSEYNNQKLNYLIPSKVIITVDNKDTQIYQLTFK